METLNHTPPQHYDFASINGMRGEVTQEDIHEGVFCDHEACALALAVERMFPGYRVFVDDYIDITDKYGVTFINTAITENLLVWIDEFDNKNPVKPIKLIMTGEYIRTNKWNWILGIQ